MDSEFQKLLERMRSGVHHSSNPMMIPRFTDKSYLIMEHGKTLEGQMAQSKPFGLQVSAQKTPDGGESSGKNVELIPSNSVDIHTLATNSDNVLEGKYFLCRTLAPPIKLTAMATIVEDPLGTLALRLSLYNFSSSDSTESLLQDLPVGQILVIKNPWFKSTQDGGYSLRVDSPGNVLLLSNRMFKEFFPTVEWKGRIPQQWIQFIKKSPETGVEWKNEGNGYFVAKKYQLAIGSYSDGLNLQHLEKEVKKDLLCNRAAAFMNMGCFHSGLNDLNQLLSLEPNHVKGIYRKGKSLSGLQRFSQVIQFLELNVPSKLADESLFKELLSSAHIQQKQQMTGEYDIPQLHSASSTTRHEGIANFRGPVRIQPIEGKGRGLVATRDISAGELLILEKAFEIVFPVENKFSMNLNLDKKLINTAEQTLLIQAVAQKVMMEPSLGVQLYSLYAGPDLPLWQGEDPDGNPTAPVDVSRIQAICLHNAYAGNIEKGTTALQSRGLHKDKSSGLWIFPSYINHSCWDSNCAWRTYGDILIVRAHQPIQQGQEILIPYMSGAESKKSRFEYLEKQGFVCGCSLCTVDSDESEGGKRRIQILELISKEGMDGLPSISRVKKLIKELEELPLETPHHNPSLLPILLKMAQFHFSRREFEKAGDLLLKCHSIAQNSHLGSFGVDACLNLIASYLMAGRVKEAKDWTVTLRRDLVECYGTVEMGQLVAPDTLGLMKRFGILL